MRWLIGIDDTDNEESIGTGRLSRLLAEHLTRAQLAAGTSITRHQLLVHPAIPYTSHNSSACIQSESGDGEKLLDAARSFLLDHHHAGANPGLCVCRADAVPELLVGIGRRAQREVLELSAFDAELRDLPLMLWSSGETGQGRIGACAGVALRSTGDDGRFIDLAGIRELCGRLSAGEIVARSGIAAVCRVDGRPLPPEAEIDTGDWVRPSLRGGRALLVVREQDGRLVPNERRSRDD